jgi:hypothetical protein
MISGLTADRRVHDGRAVNVEQACTGLTECQKSRLRRSPASTGSSEGGAGAYSDDHRTFRATAVITVVRG